MPAALLDLLDSTLQLWHGDRCVQSPGYALLNGQDYVFGTPARATARLKPRDVNTRYWWRLSTEALQPALGPARHTGDLVHAHLMQLHAEADKLMSKRIEMISRRTFILVLGEGHADQLAGMMRLNTLVSKADAEAVESATSFETVLRV